MKIYNENKTILLNPKDIDLNIGYLVPDVLETIIPATSGIEGKGYFDKNNNFITEIEGVNGTEEHIEREEIKIYKFYTKDELQTININKRKDNIRIRLEQLTEDMAQDQAGEIVPNIAARKMEFIKLHNELRQLENKEPRQIK